MLVFTRVQASSRFILLLILTGCFLWLGSCANSGGGGGSSDSIRVYNKSIQTIHSVYITTVESEYWGPNRLGNDSIRPNQSRSISGVKCETNYDIRIITQFDVLDFWNIYFICGEAGEIVVFDV